MISSGQSAAAMATTEAGTGARDGALPPALFANTTATAARAQERAKKVKGRHHVCTFLSVTLI